MRNKEFKDYNQWMKDSFNFQLNKKEYELFDNYYRKNYLKHLPKDKKIKILEIACGMGQFLYFLNKEGYKNISGIDLNKKNIEQCKKIGIKNVIKADMYNYISKLSNNKFDVIIMNDIIEHIPRERVIKYLSNIRTKLKEGGVLIIKTVNCNNVYGLSSYFSDFTHVVGYTSEKIRHVSLLSGFKECKVYNLYLYTNIFIVDLFFNIPFKIIYKIKRLLFYLNGRKTDNVFSKNLLAIIRK